MRMLQILGKGPNDPRLEDVYRVDKQIGKGAFGVVRCGTKKANNEPVAVKSISKAKLVCKEDVKDVQAEVAIMNLVAGHPYVVTLKVGGLGLCPDQQAGLGGTCVGGRQPSKAGAMYPSPWLVHCSSF